MKVVHNSHEPSGKVALLAAAREAEARDDLKRVALLYSRLIADDPLFEQAYDRLVIIYRKQKLLEKERAVLKKAIRVFDERYRKGTEKRKSPTVSRLSNAFLKLSGLSDKKGKRSFLPGPLEKWMKRLQLVEKKIKPGK